VRFATISLLALVLAWGSCCARANSISASQSPEPAAAKAEPSPEQIIGEFAQKESQFYDAWMQYAYTQKATIRVLSVDGVKQDEALTIVSEVIFRDDGTRIFRDVRRSGWLRSVYYTKQDQDIIDNINPFALRTQDLDLYDLKYEGK
jgi:hypothetical protein